MKGIRVVIAFTICLLFILTYADREHDLRGSAKEGLHVSLYDHDGNPVKRKCFVHVYTSDGKGPYAAKQITTNEFVIDVTGLRGIDLQYGVLGADSLGLRRLKAKDQDVELQLYDPNDKMAAWQTLSALEQIAVLYLLDKDWKFRHKTLLSESGQKLNISVLTERASSLWSKVPGMDQIIEAKISFVRKQLSE